jgi:hypothetical protein
LLNSKGTGFRHFLTSTAPLMLSVRVVSLRGELPGVGNLHVGRSASNLQGETGWAGSPIEERFVARLLEGEKIAALFREFGWKLVGVDMPTPEEKEVWSQLEQLG